VGWEEVHAAKALVAEAIAEVMRDGITPPAGGP
jgi:hypothetical protein